MSTLAFFDTNILVYADDDKAADKQARASALFAEHLEADTAVLSLQVLQEFFSAATKKLGMTAETAQQRIEVFAHAHLVRFNAADIIAAIELHRLTHIPFWDALIVHAARSAGVRVLYSEDFQDGGSIAGVRVVNPFLS